MSEFKANNHIMKAKYEIGQYITEREKSGADEKDISRGLCDAIIDILDQETATIKWYFLDKCEKHLQEMEKNDE